MTLFMASKPKDITLKRLLSIDFQVLPDVGQLLLLPKINNVLKQQKDTTTYKHTQTQIIEQSIQYFITQLSLNRQINRFNGRNDMNVWVVCVVIGCLIYVWMTSHLFTATCYFLCVDVNV